MKKSLLLSLAVGGVLIAGTYFIFFRSPEIPYELVKAVRGTISQRVVVTGRTKPLQDVSLAFERSGKVSRIFVAVGDRVYAGQVLAELDRAELSAQLSQAEANLETQNAKLAELKIGTRPEEILIQEGKVVSARSALSDAKQNMIDKTQESYTKADDSVRNIADQFFNNPRSANPQVSFLVADSTLKGKLENGRLELESLLPLWRQSLDSITIESDLGAYSRDAISNSNKVKMFLDNAALAVNALTPSISISQTTIDGWKTNLSAARTSMNVALANLSAAREKLSGAEANLILAENQLNLEKAGTAPEAIAAQEAQVKQAKANLESAQAQMAKAIIKTPIPGIITKQDAKVGEIVSANSPLILVISEGGLKIEANIPEVDIGKIKTGNPATVSLDAFPGETFPAKISYIDPGETIIEGVTTYKVTLQFSGKDSRIGSGMTADIDLLTAEKSDVIVIPQRAVVARNGDRIVSILVNDSVREVKVETGVRSFEGMVEITDGLAGGEDVIVSIR